MLATAEFAELERPSHPERISGNKALPLRRFRDAQVNPTPLPASRSTSLRSVDEQKIRRKPGLHKCGRSDRDDAGSGTELLPVQRCHRFALSRWRAPPPTRHDRLRDFLQISIRK